MSFMKKINYLAKEIVKILGLSAIGVAIIFYGYAFLEPTKAIAETDEVLVTQTVTSGITISDGSAINMTALTLTQDTAVGSTTWTVTTNDQAGYTLTIQASRTNALYENTTSEYFTDYTEEVAGTPETWLVSDAYEFGWSALGSNNNVDGHGTDATDDCASTYDVPSTTLLWEGFDGEEPIQMASSTVATDQDGETTTLCVATEQDTVFAPSGSYYATTTATAIVQ